jgi:hypothetical protein
VRYKERNEEYRDVFRVVIETTEKIQKIVGVGSIIYIDES